MKRSKTEICLIAVFSLLLNVLWQCPAMAATAPVITSLGQITEGLEVPTRLDVDNAGNLYVLDYDKKAVVRFDKYGKPGGVYNVPAASGTGLAVTPDGQHIYVACGKTVQVLSGATGQLEGSLGGAGQFSAAGEIDLDASGYVYVADLGTQSVKVFDASGSFRYSFGGYGLSDGQFQTISSLSVDAASGYVYVADSFLTGTRLPMLQRFDLGGVFVQKLLAGTAFGAPLATFAGMTFDQAGRAYVLDGYNSQIRVLSTPSGYLSTYANVGYLPGQLSGPNDIVFDAATGRLFVSCSNRRIEVFGIDGGANPLAVNNAPGKPTPIRPVSNGEVTDVSPVMTFGNGTDPDGDALVYDLQVFDGQGALVASYAGQSEGVERTEVLVDGPLAENQLFSWQARSFDGEAASAWTEPQSFYLNAVNEAPAASVLISPLGGESLDSDALLLWSASTDPDPFDLIAYKVEIAAGPEFADVVATQTTSDLQISLDSLTEFTSLIDGTSYFWRVAAVDSDGLDAVSAATGNFVFDTTLLKVTSNMPGARVYLGGNLGYAGRFLGETPLEIRNFPEGKNSLVVERSGFEPSVFPIDVVYQKNVQVYACLVPAVAPDQFNAHSLKSTTSLVGSAPFMVDFNQDGLLDLLVGNTDGSVMLSLAELVDGEAFFGPARSLLLQLIPAAVPFVVDWNNDGAQDLLVGAADGTVSLFVNAGSSSAPDFAKGEYLQVGGANLVVGSKAVPVVADFDADGDKDLLVGSLAGAVSLLRNVGTDAAPQFQGAEVLLSGLPAAAAPVLADWDGDGLRDLLILSAGRLYRGDKQVDGTYAAVPLLTIAADPAATASNGAGKVAKDQGRKDLVPSADLRVFIADVDGRRGKDLLVGLETGELRLLVSQGKTLVPAFAPALLDKVEQIRQAGADAPLLAEALNALSETITAGDLATAAGQANLLAADVAGDPLLSELVVELSALLAQGAELK